MIQLLMWLPIIAIVGFMFGLGFQLAKKLVDKF